MNRDRRRRAARAVVVVRTRRAAQPCGCQKRRFLDEGEAEAAAIRLSIKLGPLRVYACPRMPGFHLTRRPTWKEPT